MTNSGKIIDSLEVYVLNNPDDVKPHWVSHFIVPTANELLIKIKNKNGNSGFGLATSYSDILPIIKPFSNGLQDFIIGQDPFCPEKIYESISKLSLILFKNSFIFVIPDFEIFNIFYNFLFIFN